MRIFFKGFNFSQDGPGNRLVLHLQGCNMRCPWCSNPEGMAQTGGEEYTVEAVVRESLRSRAMFFSGGGVTFTGGEATLQWRELDEVLQALQAQGIHTALETNGSSPHLLDLQEHVDYLMMDFKHYDAASFLHYTGVPIDRVLSNYAALCASGRQLHVRIPLIHGVNDADPAGFARVLALQNTENVVFEFLPYHEYGKKKWQTEYQMHDAFITPACLAEFSRVFADYRLKTIHT